MYKKESQILQFIRKNGANPCAEIALHFGWSPKTARKWADSLVERGWLRKVKFGRVFMYQYFS